MDKKIVVIRRFLFVMILCISIVTLSRVLERKTIDGAWNYSIKVGGFENEPENSFNLIGVGSSHMYCTLSPVYLYERTGVRSYVYATQQQPPIASYYYIKNAFKRQNPDVIILEGLMFVYDNTNISEGVAHDAIDPFPMSLNKIKMIYEMNQEDKKENYYFNLLKYHTRWKELRSSDFSFDYRNHTDPFHGYVFLTESSENHLTEISSYDDVEYLTTMGSNLEILMRIKQLVEENGSKLLVLLAPTLMDDQIKSGFKTLHNFAKENNIDILDLNTVYNELGMDGMIDYYDSGHLNVYGAEKVTDYLANYIQKNYNITYRDVDDYSQWESDIEFYYSAKIYGN